MAKVKVVATIVPKKMKTELTTGTESVSTYISEVDVDSNEKFDTVKLHTDSAKALIKKTEDFFKPHVDRANVAHKALTKDRKSIIQPLQDMVDEGARKNGAYLTALRLKEEAEQLELEQAEEKRINDEAQKRAAKLKKSGKPNKAKRILREAKEEAAAVDIVTTSKAPTSSYGSTTRTNWTFTIEDEDKIPREFMTPDTVKIGQFVRQNKEKAKISGVKTEAVNKTL